MVLTRTIMKIAPIAIGGLLAILYFRGAFTKGASFAGADIGSSFQSLGTGIGSGFGSLGTGIGTLGSGIGSGIAGLFKPIWELKSLADAFGLGGDISKLSTVSGEVSPVSPALSKAGERVSSAPRTNTGGWTVATHATSGGRTR